MSVFERRNPHQFAWSIYAKIFRIGEIERKARNRGCAIVLWEEPYCVQRREVVLQVREKWEGRRIIYRDYITPIGQLTEKVVVEENHGSQWITEHMTKSQADLDILEFLINDTDFYNDFSSLSRSDRIVGEDGIVMASIGKSPLQKLLYEYMGIEFFSEILYDNRSRFNKIYDLLAEKQSQAFRIAADSPAKIIWSGDNITDVAGPNLFEEYCIPFYKEQAHLLHRHGKLYAVHMDGRLRTLVQHIANTEIDIIEAVTPPPLGNLSTKDMNQYWPDKFIWLNFPSSTAIESERAIKEFFDELLQNIDKERYLIGITEDIPVESWGKTLSIMEEYFGN